MPRDRPWLKLFSPDWRNDVKLRLCSLAARGLWIDLVALMHDESEPYGYLFIQDRVLSVGEVALLVGRPEPEVAAAWEELRVRGVMRFTEDGHRLGAGVGYSRRMVRDEETRLSQERDRGRDGKFKVTKSGAPHSENMGHHDTEPHLVKSGVPLPLTSDSMTSSSSKEEEKSPVWVPVSTRIYIDSGGYLRILKPKGTEKELSIPATLWGSSQWREAFKEWVEFRRYEKSQPLTFTAIRNQIGQMDKAGPVALILAMTDSMTQGYKGIWPMKFVGKSRAGVRPRADAGRKEKLRNVGRR